VRTSRIFTLPALMLLTVALLAQQGPNGNGPGGGPPPGGPPTATQELARLDKALTLSDEQKASILPILEKRHEEIGALMGGSSDASTAHEQMHTIIDSTNKAIRALLTESQKELFDKMGPPQPPGRGAGSQGSGGESGPPPDGGPSPQS
jgi:hypothetical protein